MNYLEKLKDPRWQKVRLKVMERDHFTCMSCMHSDKTLHVHHLTYEKGKEPWDYELDNFTTLCHECHEKIEAMQGDHISELSRLFKSRLKDTYIRDRCIKLFEEAKDLRELVTLIVDAIALGREDEVYKSLQEIVFRDTNEGTF